MLEDRKPMDAKYKEAIVSYYDKTRLDYKLLWFGKKNRSVHFGFYDETIQSHSDALIHLNRKIAEKAGIHDGDYILDAGCGQGGSSVWLAENYNVKVKGITIVPHQVAIAKHEAKKRSLSERVSFDELDYCNTPYSDESFSVVWACESMCHAENKTAFYKEAFRLLKPGGRLVFADYIRQKRPLPPEGETLLHQWLGSWSIKDIDSTEEHRNNALNAGFTSFEVNDVTQAMQPSLRHLHSMSRKLWRMGKLLKRIGLRNNVNHGNQYGSIKQFEALEKNLWYYGIVVINK